MTFRHRLGLIRSDFIAGSTYAWAKEQNRLVQLDPRENSVNKPSARPRGVPSSQVLVPITEARSEEPVQDFAFFFSFQHLVTAAPGQVPLTHSIILLTPIFVSTRLSDGPKRCEGRCRPAFNIKFASNKERLKRRKLSLRSH
jgi:hypothetical protein